MDLLRSLLHNYPYTIDFLLYFLFFGSATRVALSNHYGDHLSKRIAIPTGLILSVSLVTAQNTIGFRLEQIGPVALAIIVLAVLILVYKLMVFANIPTAASMAVTGLFAVAFARTLAPDITTELIARFPLPALLLLILAGLAAWAASTSQRTKRAASKGGRQPPGFLPDKKTLRKLRKKTARTFHQHTTHLVRNTKHAAGRTRAARKMLHNEKDSRQSKRHARAEIKRARELTHRIEASLERLQRLDRAVQEVDHQWLTKNTEVAKARIPHALKERVKSAIEQERRKLTIEEQLATLVEKAHMHAENVDALLRDVEELLDEDDMPGAERRLKQTQRREKGLLKLEYEMASLEHRLITLFKQQEWLASARPE